MAETLYDPAGTPRYFIATDVESPAIYDLSGRPIFHLSEGTVFSLADGRAAYWLADDCVTFLPYDGNQPILHRGGLPHETAWPAFSGREGGAPDVYFGSGRDTAAS
jgi:hypothetical protein